MMTPAPPPERFPGLENTLSLDRFATYLGWAGNDRDRAITLYALNARLSESLYTPLHMLEVSLRNRIHQVLTEAVSDTWFEQPEYQLNPWQGAMVAQARGSLIADRKDVTPGAMVAALTFGFWTAMLGKEYETLWQKTLKAIGRREDGKGLTRKDFTRPLGAIRTLRNRVAHHEPVLYWDLPRHHGAILHLIAWLSPAAAEFCAEQDRFPAIYPEGGIVLVIPAEETAE